MKRKQFSEEQIIGILKEAEAGAVVTDLCRRRLLADTMLDNMFPTLSSRS